MDSELPIGVFDSGIGGLTVLKALAKQLPHESFIYLGDTARLPYGLKSEHTIIRYAHQAANALIEKGIKMLIIACNTASAYALAALQASFPHIPIIGVIEAGAIAACEMTQTEEIIVLATEATINMGAYRKAIQTINPNIQVIEKACSLFVPLAEEGWLNGHIAEAIAREYIEPLLQGTEGKTPDALVLGCTHFPALLTTIRQVVGHEMMIVDSAKTTAHHVNQLLDHYQLTTNAKNPRYQFYVTDMPERFIKTARFFLGDTLIIDKVELLDL
jgi:glutamate racemase